MALAESDDTRPVVVMPIRFVRKMENEMGESEANGLELTIALRCRVSQASFAFCLALTRPATRVSILCVRLFLLQFGHKQTGRTGN